VANELIAFHFKIFVLPFAISEHQARNTRIYNFAYFSTWAWNLVSYIKERT